jgi:hypothetical protein
MPSLASKRVSPHTIRIPRHRICFVVAWTSTRSVNGWVTTSGWTLPRTRCEIRYVLFTWAGFCAYCGAKAKRPRQRVSPLSIYYCTRSLNESPTSPCHAIAFDHQSKCVSPEFGKKRPLRHTSVKTCFTSAVFIPAFSDHSFRI